MRVALVHDFLNQRGGAERVVVSLSRIFPEAPIFTSIYEPDATYEEFGGKDIRTSFLQRLPHSERIFRALLPLYPWAFRSFDLSGYDLVVSSSTNWAHGVNKGKAHHVVLCHNPPRWLHQTHQYLAAGGPAPAWSRYPLAPLFAVLRRWDRRAAARPDLYVAVSRVVAERIRGTYGREAVVVNPPVDVARFERAAAARTLPFGEGHYLLVSRLLPYKRVDLALGVFSRRASTLVVVGDGPARSELERSAASNVRFAGRVSDEELIWLYSGARALVHPAEEDFGLGPLEANAAGIPAVAFGNGGALETVKPNETGVLFNQQTGESLMKALDELEGHVFEPGKLQAHARTFGEEAFSVKFKAAIEESRRSA